jgi:DNA polymerase (family 10)
MKLDKHQIAEALAEMAEIFEIKGENPFKVRAYQNAARIIDGISEDLEELIRKKELVNIKGIGAHLADHIEELAKTGKLKEYEKLVKSIPQGLLEILRIQGVGPKKAKVLWEELSIKSVGELEYACKENRLLALPGFGEKMQEKILQGIDYLRRFENLHLVSKAQAAADEILKAIRKDKGVIKSEVAGSIRRRKELIRDIDILVATSRSGPVMDLFVSLPQVENVTAKGETKSSVLLKSGISADLRTVSDKEFPFALHYFTGSKEHNIAMRTLAKKEGIKMNEYGLFKGAKFIPCKDEAEIFEKLGLSFIPPELRENQGEIEAAAKGKLPKLVEEKDIKGIMHCHSDWSDGTAAIEAMALAAKKLGYTYIGIADHSKSAQYAGGLTEKEVKEQQREIDSLNRKLRGFTILKGIEVDILQDGSLDYSEKVLESFDFVIASIHSRFNMTEKEMTARIIKAVKNPYTSILGHPTGRLLLAREGYQVNMKEVLDAAAEYGTAVEINCHPQRLDLDWRHGKYAKSKGVKVVICPDAHSPEGLLDMAYGVGIARKGWFEKDDVLNCLSAQEIKKHFTTKIPRH